MRASFNKAIWWIAGNEDEMAGNPECPLVSESMVADLFDTTTDHVCECVNLARQAIGEDLPYPTFRAKKAVRS